MRTSSWGKVFFLAWLLLSANARADDRRLRVFLLAGQSNMEGADTQAQAIDALPPFEGAANEQPAVRYWYQLGGVGPQWGSGRWVALAPDHRGQFGPELTFARQLQEHLDAPIAIIKSAWGGTTLAEDWDPDRPSEKRLYARTLELVQEALRDLRKRRLRYRLEAVLWHQGENDMLHPNLRQGYGMRLQAFLTRLRQDLEVPDLKVFVGEISNKGIWGLDHRDPMDLVRRQQIACCAADSLAHFVPTSHLAFAVMRSGQPHYHFGTEGQLQHGQAYAQAYLRSLGQETVVHPQGFGNGLPLKKGSRVRVVLLAGQRSMEGEGAYVQELSRERRYRQWAEPQPTILYRYRLGGGAYTAEEWLPLGPVSYLGNFGPELSFGSTLDQQLDDPIALVKVTDSAAVLQDWLPDPEKTPPRPQYREVVAYVQQSLQELREAGLHPQLDAVVWMPAEHDAYWPPFRSRYGEDLSRLIAALREDFNAPRLRFVIGELNDALVWGTERLDALDQQIEPVAQGDPDVWWVETDSIAVAPDRPTPATEGTLQLGQLLAESVAEILQPPAPRSHYQGRQIAKPMSHKAADWLIRPERDQEEGCRLLLDALQIEPEQRIADIGCGNGFWTLRLAERVGAKGKVYAVEIQPEYLDLLAARAEKSGFSDRIQPVLGEVHDPRLPKNSMDLILLVDVYHEFSHPELMLATLRDALKPDGQLVLVEFRMEDPKVPIKKLHKMSRQQIFKELVPNGLQLVGEFDGLPRQHVLFFRRSP
jgi:SAM-dependent methyltransferase